MNKSKLFTKKIPYYGHFDVVVFWVAGVADGLAVTDNYTPENINVDQLQTSIREQDVILD